MIKDIKFKITLFIDNLVTGKLDVIHKTVTRKDVELEAGVAIQIDKKNILNYFDRDIKKYLSKNNVSMDEIAIDGYEVKSKDKDVDVFFKTEDIEQFSFEPAVMARLLKTKMLPVLRCEQIDNTTVKWYWELQEDKMYYLVDEKDSIIAQVPIGVDYYIESGLEEGHTYRRFVYTYGEDGAELKSTECSITLQIDRAVSEYTKFSIEKRREDIMTINDQYSTRLKAFASGVGDNLDCKLFKPDDTKYAKRFRLINKVYGVRASDEVKHHTIQFDYRFVMKGVYDHLTYNATAKVKLKAYEILNNKSMTLGPEIVCEKDYLYQFNDNTQVADIYFYSLIPELPKTYKKRYLFQVEVYDVTGEISIYSYENGICTLRAGEKKIYEEQGYYDHKFTIKAEPVVVKREYKEVYPPMHFEPLTGAVNGDFQVHKDGKKDMKTKCIRFDASESVYDRKYYCVIEKISPTDAYVQYRWDNDNGKDNYTLVNGDGITFYSDCILEDETEYRDFLTQIEQGEFIISDNRRHRYTYDIDEIKVNPKLYKRFELDVVSSTNDVAILSATKDLEIGDDNQVISQIDVSVRGVQNAIAKWNPMIHNGYYYYNQDEYFLYSKCTAEGEGRIVEDVYYKPFVSSKAVIEAVSPPGPTEYYEREKASRDELLLDEYTYEFENNKIWPQPYSVPNDYFMDFHEVYNYYTAPFVFPNAPTRYEYISWDQTCIPKNYLNVYAIAYDDVRGVWNEPVHLTHGAPVPAELKMTKVMRLLFEMRPSRRPELIRRELITNSEGSWKEQMDNFLSSNIYITEECMLPKSKFSDGVYISKVIDLGDTADETKGRSILPEVKAHGEIEFYIQEGDSLADLENQTNFNTWRKVDFRTKVSYMKRYYRFQIRIKPESILYSLTLKVARYEYTNLKKEDYVPGFGNIRLKAAFDPTATNLRFENIVTHSLPFDGLSHILIEDVDNYLQEEADRNKISKNQIVNFTIFPYGSHQEDFVVGRVGNSIEIASLKVLYDNDLMEQNQAGAKFPIDSNGVITVSPIPQQYSPVLLSEDGSDETYTQVFFCNDDGYLTLENTEEFESLGFRTLYLQYLGIDKETIKVKINNKKVTNFDLVNNVLVFENEVESGSIIKVKYKLKNSFYVAYDYEKDEANIVVHKESGEAFPDLYRVYYEVNKTSSMRSLKDICMNPIYNAVYQGYIYICDYQLDPYEVEVIPSHEFIFANGKDSMNVIIRVKDYNGNPLQNIDVNVAAALGSIEKMNEKTDINGIIRCKYTSWTGSCEDIVKATATRTARGEARIINRKL